MIRVSSSTGQNLSGVTIGLWPLTGDFAEQLKPKLLEVEKIYLSLHLTTILSFSLYSLVRGSVGPYTAVLDEMIYFRFVPDIHHTL